MEPMTIAGVLTLVLSLMCLRWAFSKNKVEAAEEPKTLPLLNGKIIGEDKVVRYYKNGLLHNEDGAAVITPMGKYKEWWIEGKKQRTEHRNEQGKLHRDGGPAVIAWSGEFVRNEYWENGSRFQPLVDGGRCFIMPDRILYMKDGKAHREDGPAIEWENGRQEWYLDGKIHRTDGPAIISKAEGIEAWYQDGKRHRTGGAALIHKKGNGTANFWYENDQWIRTEFRDQHLRLHDANGPAVKCKNGKQEWWKEGKLQKTVWYNKNNELHRVDGPAVIHNVGLPHTGKANKEWWVNGKRTYAIEGKPYIPQKHRGIDLRSASGHTIELRDHKISPAKLGAVRQSQKDNAFIKCAYGDSFELTDDDLLKKIYSVGPVGFPKSTFDQLDDAIEELKMLLEEESDISFKVKEMTAKEYNNLDEFQGY